VKEREYDMIQKIICGTPIRTDAVIIETETVTKLTLLDLNQENLHISYQLDEEDVIYGLGEAVRGINKRGWIYESNCTDNPNHREDTHSLYGAHNFILVDGKERFGLFVDYAGKVTFDLGYHRENEAVITVEDWNFTVYVITGESCLEIIKQFRHMIGQSYVPPKWAFGYGQSRWSYMNADEVREVAARHREALVPLDSIYLDIDYMEDYKDFTVNEERFPDFPAFVEEMKQQGIHLVPIIDAGVKIEMGYPVYEEGVTHGYFCKKADGTDFVAGVWPGRVHFPDVLNQEARRWFGMKYQYLLDQGIEGFWNDMNEPAMFYSEDHLKQVFQEIDQYKEKELDLSSYFEFVDLVSHINNNANDYRSFYHNMDGMKYRHDKVHNLYGYFMTRSAAEAFEEINPDKRILLFSRASYIGMHRYGGIWTGDNMSWWSHLLLSIKMLPSLNMCGFLYSGCDLGGFGSDTTQDLMLRWLAVGIFMPLMRNHSALGTRRQEFYQFERTDAFVRMIGLRYALLPYLYSEFMKAVFEDGMLFLPLAFAYPSDARAKRIEDQVMVGESIMIAPVYEQNARGRYIYLPEDMKLIRFHSARQYEEEIYEAGDHYIEIGLDEVVIFLRKEHLLPIGDAVECVDQITTDHLRLISYGTGVVEYKLYDDDGATKQFGSYQTLKADTLES